MFTGIVETMGTVTTVEDMGGLTRLVISSELVTEGMQVGDSIACNGVCLTAVALDGPQFAVEAVPETLARSNLGALVPGDGIDLERPLAASGRFDGHIVQGHVDGVGVVREVTPEGGAVRMWVDVPAGLRRYLVEKGSVAMDGVSLTVSGVDERGFEVVLIPHTLEVTVLGSRGPGSRVNLEMDVLAKYVERLMEERE
jgi:riboflavin synthase